jgi:hypothetical protein
MTKMTPLRLQSLHDLAAQLDEQPEGGQFLEVRVRFYRELYDAENNPLLVEMIEELRSHVGRYLLSFRFDGQHRNRHLELVNHVESGDLTGAEAWLYSHLESVRAGIQELATDEAGDEEGGGEGDSSLDEGDVATMAELAFNNDAVLTSALNADAASNGRSVGGLKAGSKAKAGAAKSKSAKASGAKAGSNVSARRLTKAVASRGGRASR